MSKREKLIEKLKRLPPEADYNDVEQLLVDFAWSRDRASGSHNTFCKADEYPITVPKLDGRKVKRVYVK